MFRSNLKLVPWRNREEWETVYKNAFTDDPETVRMACDVMEIWLCLRNDIPPAIECTYSLIQVLLKDRELNDTNDWSNVGLMFSTAILRVVNLIADTSRQKDSLYRLAQNAQIPDWIITLRHDIAHGKALPDPSGLRMAANFLLQWIKTFYWDVENEDYSNVVIEESREVVFQRNIKYLVKEYIQARSTYEDEEFDWNELEKHSIMAAWNSVAPWLIIPKVKFPNGGMSLSHDILVHLLKYFDPSLNMAYDPIPVLLPIIFAHFKEHNAFVLKTWEEFVDAINQNQTLGQFFLALSQSDVSVARDTWISTLIQAIFCRQKVDANRLKLMESHYFEDGPEAKVAANTVLRRRLNLDSDSTEDEIISELYRRLKKKHPEYNDVLILNSPIDYLHDECYITSALQELVAKPYPDIYPLIDQLLPMIKPRLGEKMERHLKALIGFMLGERGSRPLVNKKIYTLLDLKRDEQEDLPDCCEAVAPKRSKNTDNSSTVETAPKTFYRCSLPQNIWLDTCEKLNIQRCDIPKPAHSLFPVT